MIEPQVEVQVDCESLALMEELKAGCYFVHEGNLYIKKGHICGYLKANAIRVRSGVSMFIPPTTRVYPKKVVIKVS